MAEKKGPRIFRVLPSIQDVIFLMVLAILLGGEANLLGDADTGYHIRAGEYIIENLGVPHHDIFSQITPPLPWTAHEWLSEVIYALIHKAFGLTGLAAATAVFIASVYVVLMRFLRASGVSIIVSALLVAVAAGASTIHWLARPHIFSLLLTLLWYIVLDTYRTKDKNYLYWLPLSMLLWVNLHGGFLAGFILLAVYITEDVLNALFVKEKKPGATGRLNTLLFISFLCLLASLVNPRGYEILLFPFKLTGNQYLMDHVHEFLSPNFHTALRFEYMLLLMIFVFGVSVLRLNAAEAMLVLLFTHMSLFSARYIPLYAILLCPIIGKRMDHIIDGLRKNRLIQKFLSLSDRMATTDSRTTSHLWSFVAVVVVVFLLATGKLEYAFNKDKDPVDAVRFMKQEKIKGNMFNNDEFGDYIIYAAWPEYKVFFDGRSDMYGAGWIKEYFKVTGIRRGWDDVLRKNNVNWIIYNNDSPLCNFLLASDEWKLIYADKIANIFVRNIPDNQQLIDKYPNVKPVPVEEKSEKED